MSSTQSQGFRARSSSEVITIPTRQDPKSGQRVVRWKDIQQYFENVKGLVNGKDAVLFLTDDDLEEIAHHPGLVLEVLVEGNSSTNETIDSTASGITEIEDYSQALIVHPQGQRSETPSIHASDSPNAQLREEQQPASITRQFNHEHSPRLKLEMSSVISQQEELRQLKQQIEEILQKIQHTKEQLDSIPDMIQHSEQQTRQQLQQQVEEIQKMIPPLKGYVDEANGNILLDQLRNDPSQRLQEMFSRHILLQYRAQAFVDILSEHSSAPRLFLILPKENSDDRQEACSRQFRLYFLCESHTKDKNTIRETEFHMTNHPGYDIKKLDAFLNKYGSYILMVMYLVKYGATIPGLVVPPLGQSKIVSRINEDQDNLGFIKKNIAQLMDDTIAYLERMTCTVDSGMDITSNRNMITPPTDRKDFGSYLGPNYDYGNHSSVDLHQSTKQKRHCSWVCSEHRYEWLLRCLKDIVGLGSFSEGCDVTGRPLLYFHVKRSTKQLNKAIVKLYKAIPTNNETSLLVRSQEYSLKIETFQTVKVAAYINKIGYISDDDIELLQELETTELSLGISDESDERLVEILRSLPRLKKIQVGCSGERLLAFIDLAISTREWVLQDAHSIPPQILRLTETNSTWCQEDWDSFEVTLTFSNDSTIFDIDTHLDMGDNLLNWTAKNTREWDAEGECESSPPASAWSDPKTGGSSTTEKDQTAKENESWRSKFLRQYGWAISSLNTSGKFDDRLAIVLDTTTRTYGSRLTRLSLSPTSLTSVGLDAVDRIIRRSQKTLELALDLEKLYDKSQLENAELLLRRYGRRLSRFSLHSNGIVRWLPRITQSFPSRECFPILDGITIACKTGEHPLPDCIRWLAKMVSVPPQLQGSSSTKGSHAKGTQGTAELSEALIRLKRFKLSNITLTSQEWEILLKAIDFSVLQCLVFLGTNFGMQQATLLFECIASTGATSVPLETLLLPNLCVPINCDYEAKIRAVAPQVNIHGFYCSFFDE
ncbi:hypothetical protein BGX31_009643 [Mortierella sp. GBA43]|nr:hypothetical protein BGX31_009643 [Mortierella sp. GBA43]